MTTPLTLITGASRGLGLALLELRLQQGHRVLAIARKRPRKAAVNCSSDWLSFSMRVASAPIVVMMFFTRCWSS